MSRHSNPSGLNPWTPDVGIPELGSVPVTAIVLTLNEAVNIERCVRSLGWCSHILLVDSGSTDGTVEIAESAGAEVVHHPFEGFSAQRNWALRSEAVRREWILFVDADEWVSGKLAREIASAVQAEQVNGFAMRRRLVFQGRWIKYAGWYRSSWLVRLVRADSVVWQGEVSEKPVVEGATGRLSEDLVDEDLKGLEAWLARHNTYSTLKARQREQLRQSDLSNRVGRAMNAQPRTAIPREMAKQVVAPSLPAPGFFRFIYMYVFRGGFLMGPAGFRFCRLHAMQEMHITMKIEEANRARDEQGTSAAEESQ